MIDKKYNKYGHRGKRKKKSHKERERERDTNNINKDCKEIHGSKVKKESPEIKKLS